jgi:hypothetical protein
MVDERRPPEGDGQAPDELLHPTVQYEHSDASFAKILAIIIGALILAGIIHYVVWQFFVEYRGYEATINASHYPLGHERSGHLPPEPRLEQINRMSAIESGNIYLREGSKLDVLNGYGPAADESGYVHIPIGRAMDVLANEKKLLSRQEPPAEQRRRQNGLVDSGESNSGRLFREKPRWYEP